MSMTRRDFTIAGTTAVTLTVLGCGDSNGGAPPVQSFDEKGGKNRANLATEPFTIGKPKDYAKAGYYDAFKADKGVWVISDGKEIVVFSATCTHTGCTTNWVEDAKCFRCPCHKSDFGLDGTQKEGAKAKRPLDRCAVKLVKGKDKDGKEADVIEVNPKKLLKKTADKNEWSDPEASVKVG